MRKLNKSEKLTKQKKTLRAACFEIKNHVGANQICPNKEQTIRKSSRDFPDGRSAVVPPDSIPNSEVKRSNADGSVGFPHVRVGHHQGFIKVKKPQVRDSLRFFAF